MFSYFTSRKQRLIQSSFIIILLCINSALCFVKEIFSHAELLEQHTETILETARSNTLILANILLKMPKGGDLHNHLSGAVYAENYLQQAVEDDMCVELNTLTLLPKTACTSQHLSVKAILYDKKLYDKLINAFSMRQFVESGNENAANHFFAAFDKFSQVDSKHTGEWLHEVANRAAYQNEQYMELMLKSRFEKVKTIAKELKWQDDFESMRKEVLAHHLQEDIIAYTFKLTEYENKRNELGQCNSLYSKPACKVTLRYLYQILREFPKEQFFVQALLGFEIANHDKRVVGVNLVMPENGLISMRDYQLHMKIIDFFHHTYPNVHISLHAGEIKYGDVPPEDLCCHIHLALEQGHAERIGHGTGVMYEHEPFKLLKQLADNHTLIEINLTSNAIILGVKAERHPFPILRKFGVPVALSTDDEGVSRIDLTHEFLHAVLNYHLHYIDLKQLARASIEHSFLSGKSIWKNKDSYSEPVLECKDFIPINKPSDNCAEFLKNSEKAQQQWELEKRFYQFETELFLHQKSDYFKL